MIRMTIDGGSHSGNYQVDCECGTKWHGQGEVIHLADYSPALPIAECVVHLRMSHPDNGMDIRFTDRFSAWLATYWDRASRRLARDQVGTAGRRQPKL